MIIEAILKINPSAEVIVNAEDFEQITWLNGTTPIPKADIEAQFPAVELDIAMADLRAKRNAKLAETDFHGMSDNTMSAEMTTYRQELRDLTNGVTTKEQAESVVFPTKP
jgi:hypothetical protein